MLSTYFKVNVQGISGPCYSICIGTLRKSGGGQLIFNSNGSQFAQVSWKGMIELYNFDRCTGTITSTIPIEQEPGYLHPILTLQLLHVPIQRMIRNFM
jgi:hypothetical protein